MAGDTIDLIVKDLAAVMDRLKTFSGEATKQRLTDLQLSAVLVRLRAEGVWGDSNEGTLKNMVAGGGYTRPQAFQILTAGSAPVKRAVDAVLATWDDEALGPEPVEAEVVSITVEPDAEPDAKRPGRPRKPRKAE